MNERDEVVYATPLKRDTKLPPVAHPLPIKVDIEEGSTTDIELEVVEPERDDPIVIIENALLEANIRERKNEWFKYMYASEIRAIEKLFLWLPPVTSLNDVEKLTHLSELHINCTYKDIDDFTPLTKVTSLRNLEITYADFSNPARMGFFVHMNGLKRLRLYGSQ